MLDDVSTSAMPTRSRLYSLPLSGSCGSTQEALLDYAQRLSVAHGVKVRQLFALIVLPEADLQGAFFVPGHFSAHAVRGCSGWSRYALALLAAMQRLTGREDLARGSLASWAGLLDSRGYVARSRRWCPECLREQSMRGIHTFRLSWAFDAVRVCTIHQLLLRESCHRCGKAQPVIGDALAHGLCEHCQANLAQGPARTVRPSTAVSDFFNARAVVGMIDACETAAGFATSSVYKQRLREAAEHAANGSIFRLEKRLNLSYGSLSGASRPTLGFFLEIMYRLGVEPVTFLTAAGVVQPDPSLSVERYRRQRHLTPAELLELRKRVDSRLDQALHDQTRLTTRLELVRDVGINNSCLQAHFGDVKASLHAHNDRIRPDIHRAIWKHRSDLIRQAMCELVAKGGPYTAAAIARSLRAIGVHRRNPRVRRLAIDALDHALENAPLGSSTDPEH